MTDLTIPQKNPYLDRLEIDFRNAESVEEFEKVCAVLEYVNRVQMKALLEFGAEADDIDEEIKSAKEVQEARAKQKAVENDPKAEFQRMYEEFLAEEERKKREEGDN